MAYFGMLGISESVKVVDIGWGTLHQLIDGEFDFSTSSNEAEEGIEMGFF